MSYLSHLECGWCGERYEADRLLNLCACGRPLLARYDLERARAALAREQLAAREATMWRYAELLPVPSRDAIVSLGEGWTPLLAAPRLGARLGLSRLFVKDEGLNPTGSFKARGMSAAVTMARARGATALAVPSAGNAGGAHAGLAGRAGDRPHREIPAKTPRDNKIHSEY
jgi:threonine synthase